MSNVLNITLIYVQKISLTMSFGGLISSSFAPRQALIMCFGVPNGLILYSARSHTVITKAVIENP